MRWLLAVVMLAGCSAIYGLDGVKTDDRDSDGIPDAIDNCPDIANHDQSDVDMNGVGDACQLCMATDPTDSDGDGIPDQCDGCDNRQPDNNHDGIPDACENAAPAHDEDGDGVADIHDNCPSVANPDQQDDNESGAIADGVGNACDDSLALDRQLFDSFAQPNQLWLIDGGSWQVAGDQAMVAPASPVFRYAGMGRTTFRVTTHVTVPAGDEALVVAVDGAALGKQTKIECGLLMMTGGSSVVSAITVNGIAQPPITSSYTGTGSDTLTLSVTTPTVGSLLATCTAGTQGPVPSQILTASSAFTTGLGATSANGLPTSSSSPVAFDYFDVVTSAQ